MRAERDEMKPCDRAALGLRQVCSEKPTGTSLASSARRFDLKRASTILRQLHFCIVREAIILNSRRHEPRQAMLTNRLSPDYELGLSEGVATTSLFERDEAAFHGGDNFSLTICAPSLERNRWQSGYTEAISSRSNHVSVSIVTPKHFATPRVIFLC